LGVSESTALHYQQSDPDVRLMLRVRDDDAGAFAELVQRYEARLVRLMRTIGPRADLAEDLTQETFMRVFRARKSYHPGAKFSTWLFTIAGNVARNSARSVGRRHEVNEVDAPLGPSETSKPRMLAQAALDRSGLMPNRIVEGSERAAVVRAAVAKLSERQRMAMMLSRFENMSYIEIAETMDLTTKAVKSLLSRARVNLKESLQTYIDTGVLDLRDTADDIARDATIENDEDGDWDDSDDSDEQDPNELGAADDLDRERR
jgi:RNA polymerase sigma-70 factor, ECF subfamily